MSARLWYLLAADIVTHPIHSLVTVTATALRCWQPLTATSTHTCPSPLPRAALGPSEYMTTSTTNATFYVNTTPSTFDQAQAACRASGGNLAAYTSLEEQQVRARGTMGL